MIEKVHSVTRPAWAINGIEMLVNFAIAVLLAAATVLSAEFRGWLSRYLNPVNVPERLTSFFEAALVGLAFTFLATAVFWFYSWIKTHGFPKTFVYLFERPDHSYTIGSFDVFCDKEKGAIYAEGRAYDMLGGTIPANAEPKPWKSLHVGATEEHHDQVTCYIPFEIRHRTYTKGLIALTKTNGVGIVQKQAVYRGDINVIEMQAQTDTGLPVYGDVYAELINQRLTDNDRASWLRDHAQDLISARKTKR